MVCESTIYYRKNKATKRIIHSCPHCEYKTTNSKITLQNHINAVHVCESKRPFQCTHCPRGFAQKAHLIGHLKNVHNIIHKPDKVTAILYIITVTAVIPTSRNTLARRNYYLQNRTLKSTDIYKKKHIYLPNIYLKNHDIHYDLKKGFITMKRINLIDCIKIKGRGKPVRIQ